MSIYVCRVDYDTFWSEAECHYHVDRHHPEWGHAVCVNGGPSPFQCKTCSETFDTKTNCEAHISTQHSKTGDLSDEWTLVIDNAK